MAHPTFKKNTNRLNIYRLLQDFEKDLQTDYPTLFNQTFTHAHATIYWIRRCNGKLNLLMGTAL